jgi:hypothetical protein
MISTKARQREEAEIDKEVWPAQPQAAGISGFGFAFLIWTALPREWIGKHYAFCHPYRDKRGASSPMKSDLLGLNPSNYLPNCSIYCFFFDVILTQIDFFKPSASGFVSSVGSQEDLLSKCCSCTGLQALTIVFFASALTLIVDRVIRCQLLT